MSKLSIGVSEVDVTPGLGVPLGGFSCYRPASSIRDRLKVKSLVIRYRSRTVLIIAVDAFAIPNGMMQRLRMSIAREAGIRSDSVIVAASHTHSAPDTLGFSSAGNRQMAIEYLRFLESSILRAAGIALRDSSNVRAYFASGKAFIGFNRVRQALSNEVYQALLRARLLWYLSQLEKTIPLSQRHRDEEAVGPVDPKVNVIWFEPQDGCGAAIVNYACHPTVLGARSRMISADYPGELTARIDRYLGKCFTTLFINGASGDINPISCSGYMCNGASSDVRRLGELVGDEAVRAMAEDSIPMEASLEAVTNSFPILGTDSTISSIRIGDRVMSAIPGELFAETGLEISQQTSGRALISSTANGYMGYLPPKTAFSFRCRETEQTWWNRAQRGCAETICRTLTHVTI